MRNGLFTQRDMFPSLEIAASLPKLPLEIPNGNLTVRFFTFCMRSVLTSMQNFKIVIKPPLIAVKSQQKGPIQNG